MWIHKYTLHALDPLNSKTDNKTRLGFFIKDSDFKIKDDPIKNFLQFSDFIHWPELGDPDLKNLKPFLMEYAQSELNYPFTLSDADLVPVKSNALINTFTPNLGENLEKYKESNFEVLKFKMGRQFEAEFKQLMKMNLNHFLLRVDLNSTFNFKESKEILELLKKIPNLEYAEDPCPYHDYYWSELEKIGPLALDNLADLSIRKPKHFQYRIVKPVRGFSLEDLKQMTFEKKKIVLTNLMDNAVGTWKTYLYFCELKKHIPYHLCTPGFYTHTLFADYPFSKYLPFTGAQWTYDSEKLSSLTKALLELKWLHLSYTDSTGLDKLIQDSEPYR